MNLNRRLTAGLLLLLIITLVVLVLGVFLLPRSLVKAHVCSKSLPFHAYLPAEICSPTNMASSSSEVVLYKPVQTTSYEKTLNVATSIFVVSLARRIDRRSTMDRLREALNLDWTYFDALDKNDLLVDDILHSVARRRAVSPSSTFEWPDSLEDKDLEFLGVDTPMQDASTVNSASSTAFGSEPLLCAIGDNSIPAYANTSLIAFHMKLSRGMVACWYSHVRLMAEIVKRTHHLVESSWDGREGVTVVFEDDVDVEWDLRKRMEIMWKDLPRDWDIVMLGHCWSNESTNPSLTPTSSLHPSHYPKCTHGYVLSPFGARRLLTHLTYPAFAFSRALDQAIAHLIRTGRIRSFSVVPSIVVQRRCPLEDYDNSTLCTFTNEKDGYGDSDIWMKDGRKGSLWRDTLQDSALDRIWQGDAESVRRTSSENEVFG